MLFTTHRETYSLYKPSLQDFMHILCSGMNTPTQRLMDSSRFITAWSGSTNTHSFCLTSTFLWNYSRPGYSKLGRSAKVNSWELLWKYFTCQMPFLSPNQQHQSTEGWCRKSMCNAVLPNPPNSANFHPETDLPKMVRCMTCQSRAKIWCIRGYGWLGGVKVRASDLRSRGRGFDSWSGHYQAT